MAEKRFLDVWIMQSNTVYREVPFAVVTDWVQQGRLLVEDQVRPSGTNQWARIDAMPAFTPYIPKPEPFRAEDKAEALEPVHVELAWRRPRGAEDDDVDMIPLIDVSLVLLIFFMLTARPGEGSASSIPTPPAANKFLRDVAAETLWVGITKDKDSGAPVYSLGKGTSGPLEGGDKLTESQVLNLLDGNIQDSLHDVRIMANKDLPYSVVKHMIVELEKRRPKGPADEHGVRQILADVSEKEG